MKALEGLMFASQVCAWGFAVSTLSLLPWVFYRFVPNVHERIGYIGEHREVLVSTAEVCRRAGTAFERYVCFEMDSGLVLLTMVNVLLPLFWIVYIKLPWRLMGTFFLYQVVANFFCVSLLYLSPEHAAARLYLPIRVLTGTLPVVILAMYLKSWQLLKWSVQFFCLFMFGTGFIVAYDALYGEVHILILILVIIPTFRGLMLGLCRVLVRPMFIQEYLPGSRCEIQVRREMAWFILLFLQIVFALLARMLLANVYEWGNYALLLGLNLIFELSGRYFPYVVDTILEKWQIQAGSSDKMTAIVMPVTGERIDAKHLHQQQHMENMKKQWHAFILAGDMISEYIAIFINIGWLLIFSDAIFMMPLPVFEMAPNRFEAPMPTKSWIYQAASQLVVELAIDWFCCSLENCMLHLPTRKAWGSKSTLWRCSILFMSASCATMYVFGFFRLRNESGLQECSTIDVCSCEPRPTSLYGKYCSFLHDMNDKHNHTVF